MPLCWGNVIVLLVLSLCIFVCNDLSSIVVAPLRQLYMIWLVWIFNSLYESFYVNFGIGWHLRLQFIDPFYILNCLLVVFCDYIRSYAVLNIDISLVDLMSNSAFVFSSHKGHTELPFAEEVDLVSITVKVLRLRDGSNGIKFPAVVLNSHL